MRADSIGQYAGFRRRASPAGRGVVGRRVPGARPSAPAFGPSPESMQVAGPMKFELIEFYGGRHPVARSRIEWGDGPIFAARLRPQPFDPSDISHSSVVDRSTVPSCQTDPRPNPSTQAGFFRSQPFEATTRPKIDWGDVQRDVHRDVKKDVQEDVQKRSFKDPGDVRSWSASVRLPGRRSGQRFRQSTSSCSAASENAHMFSTRSLRPVSSVMDRCTGPSIAMQLWPAASP